MNIYIFKNEKDDWVISNCELSIKSTNTKKEVISMFSSIVGVENIFINKKIEWEKINLKDVKKNNICTKCTESINKKTKEIKKHEKVIQPMKKYKEVKKTVEKIQKPNKMIKFFKYIFAFILVSIVIIASIIIAFYVTPNANTKTIFYQLFKKLF